MLLQIGMRTYAHRQGGLCSEYRSGPARHSLLSRWSQPGRLCWRDFSPSLPIGARIVPFHHISQSIVRLRIGRIAIGCDWEFFPFRRTLGKPFAWAPMTFKSPFCGAPLPLGVYCFTWMTRVSSCELALACAYSRVCSPGMTCSLMSKTAEAMMPRAPKCGRFW